MDKISPKQKFLFLDIKDKDIAGFIIALRNIFLNRESVACPHITLRGPYKTAPSKEIKKKLSDLLVNEEIEISGVGMFENKDKYIVYLAVSKCNLEPLSWKKDFPISKYGFNPHISVYEGNNYNLATQILNFLDQQNICLTCHSLGWSLHKKGDNQAKINLFFSTPKELIEKGGIYCSVITEAIRLMEPYNSNKNLTTGIRHWFAYSKMSAPI